MLDIKKVILLSGSCNKVEEGAGHKATPVFLCNSSGFIIILFFDVLHSLLNVNKVFL